MNPDNLEMLERQEKIIGDLGARMEVCSGKKMTKKTVKTVEELHQKQAEAKRQLGIGQAAQRQLLHQETTRKAMFAASPYSRNVEGTDRNWGIESVDVLIPEPQQQENIDDLRWNAFKKMQRDSKMMRLQLLLTDPADLLVADKHRNLVPQEMLDNEALDWVSLNPLHLSDTLFEALTDHSLAGLSELEKFHAKTEFMPLLRQLFKDALVLRNMEQSIGRNKRKQAREVPAYRMMMLRRSGTPVDGKLVIFANREYRQREHERPVLQVFDSAYKALRSQMYATETLDSDRSDLNYQSTRIDEILPDIGSIRADQTEAIARVQEVVGEVASNIAGRTRSKTSRAGEQLTQAASLQDKRGRHNPGAASARTASARDHLDMEVSGVVRKKSRITGQQDFLRNIVEHLEGNMDFLLREVERHGQDPIASLEDKRIRFLLHVLQRYVPSVALNKKDEFLPEPFLSYYNAVTRRAESITRIVQGNNPEELPLLNQEIVKITTILKMFEAHKQAENVLSQLRLGDPAEEQFQRKLRDVYEQLRDFYKPTFSRQRYRVQPETRIPEYNEPFHSVRLKIIEIGQKLGELQKEEGLDAETKKERLLAIANAIRNFDFVAGIRELN